MRITIPRRREHSDAAAMQALRPVPRISIQAFCETEGIANPIERAADDRRMSKAHLKVHMGGIATAIEFYQIGADAEPDHPGVAPRAARAAGIAPATGRILRSQHQGRRHRPLQRCLAVSRADPLRHLGICRRADLDGRYRQRHRRHLRRPRRRADRQVDRLHRRQGRRRLLDDRPQRGVGDVDPVPVGGDRRRSRPRRSAPPTSISTRIRRKASPRRCSRPSASTRSISTACSRNARSTCRCWPHLRRSTASTISIRTPSSRSSTRRSAARRCSCSTFRMAGTAGPRAP